MILNLIAIENDKNNTAEFSAVLFFI